MNQESQPTSQALSEAYRRVRDVTEHLAAPLGPEDQMLQSMPSCSPTKWHRAHTTWFFETFVLVPHGLLPVDTRWSELFNSYYESVGPRHARPKRGLLSRPTLDEVAAYRREVDTRVLTLLSRLDERALVKLAPLMALGLAHEEQHQELILTDILHALHENPLKPAYTFAAATPRAACEPLRFVAFDGGLRGLGAAKSTEFRFDNEEPRHRVYVAPFAIADRLLTVGEWKAFDDAGGYARPEFWLAEGFEWSRANHVCAPLYAHRDGDTLVQFGLHGMRQLHDEEPLAHVSYYEADAIARYFDARLPTEAEWEVAASDADTGGANLLDEGALRPLPATGAGPLRQRFGDAWEWTQSAYAPYPGYRPARGAVGEYNGKFMVSQLVLRGGSCLTPRRHIRSTYRNFWHPDTRFQVTGVRLARDLGGA